MKTKKYFISGKRVYLRPIRLSDVRRNYRAWMNDPQVNRFMESRFKKWSMVGLINYIREINKDPGRLFFAIILKDVDKHIGNIKIGPVNWNHKFANISIVIGEKSLWGNGLAAESLRLAINYAFNSLKIHKLTAGIYEKNIGSLKAFKKVGFVAEGRLKNQYMYNGRYIDAVLLGISRK